MLLRWKTHKKLILLLNYVLSFSGLECPSLLTVRLQSGTKLWRHLLPQSWDHQKLPREFGSGEEGMTWLQFWPQPCGTPVGWERAVRSRVTNETTMADLVLKHRTPSHRTRLVSGMRKRLSWLYMVRPHATKFCQNILFLKTSLTHSFKRHQTRIYSRLRRSIEKIWQVFQTLKLKLVMKQMWQHFMKNKPAFPQNKMYCQEAGLQQINYFLTFYGILMRFFFFFNLTYYGCTIHI